jgi:hypothetical protein
MGEGYCIWSAVQYRSREWDYYYNVCKTMRYLYSKYRLCIGVVEWAYQAYIYIYYITFFTHTYSIHPTTTS